MFPMRQGARYISHTLWPKGEEDRQPEDKIPSVTYRAADRLYQEEKQNMEDEAPTAAEARDKKIKRRKISRWTGLYKKVNGKSRED
ncbi:unnamed protein product [Enterobius vermicularis]|uniref:Integrase n=1 Tax=Enterobius vermicularis TaxID=51028 RepID=A0A0N4UXJ9_ENTVE|nr:unnamed protein product [Enterobius vermicularis]